VPAPRLATFPGMGHNLPRELWPAICDEIHSYDLVVAKLPRHRREALRVP
jgi:hypothetical protein